MSEEDAYGYVRATLNNERIEPYDRDELLPVSSAERCINCGVCLSHCPVVRAVGVNRFTGPRSIAVEMSRSPPEFWSCADKIYMCTGCGTCREACPRNVDIPMTVNLVRSRVFRFRPDLVPRGLHKLRETILKYSLAFEPWEDPVEKIESRRVRLERLGLPSIPDRVEQGMDVLYFPGCQAEERVQEVREAAKLVLEHLNVRYTMMDKFSCCGLPSRLMGDREMQHRLAGRLKTEIESLGIREIVTTCAGCASNLSDVMNELGLAIPVYHLVEFLIERIGTDRLLSAFRQDASGQSLRVAVHDPCHLIRHISRTLTDYSLQVLRCIPGVEVVSTGVSDSCCGGGGLVSHHSPDIADIVVSENITGIVNAGAERVVTPCPLCAAQIERGMFKSDVTVEVDDLTVFIAQRLSMRG